MPPEQAAVAAGFGVVDRARGLLIPVLKAASSTARHFLHLAPLATQNSWHPTDV